MVHRQREARHAALSNRVPDPVDRLHELRVIGAAAHAQRPRHVRRPHRDDVDALGRRDGVDVLERR